MNQTELAVFLSTLDRDGGRVPDGGCSLANEVVRYLKSVPPAKAREFRAALVDEVGAGSEWSFLALEVIRRDGDGPATNALLELYARSGRVDAWAASLMRVVVSNSQGASAREAIWLLEKLDSSCDEMLTLAAAVFAYCGEDGVDPCARAMVRACEAGRENAVLVTAGAIVLSNGASYDIGLLRKLLIRIGESKPLLRMALASNIISFVTSSWVPKKIGSTRCEEICAACRE